MLDTDTDTDVTCFICRAGLDAHTSLNREAHDQQPIAEQVMVIHAHPAEMASRVVARVMSVLAMLRPVDK